MLRQPYPTDFHPIEVTRPMHPNRLKRQATFNVGIRGRNVSLEPSYVGCFKLADGVPSGTPRSIPEYNRGSQGYDNQSQKQKGDYHYCLYLERLSAAYLIKNEETFLTGFDLP